MKLLIVGSRSIKEFDISPYIPADTEIIISGGANGIDSIAEAYADKHNISKMILRPQYNLYQKSAPLKRNNKMIELADNILVFWDGVSKGTKYSIDYALELKKNINIIFVEL